MASKGDLMWLARRQGGDGDAGDAKRETSTTPPGAATRPGGTSPLLKPRKTWGERHGDSQGHSQTADNGGGASLAQRRWQGQDKAPPPLTTPPVAPLSTDDRESPVALARRSWQARSAAASVVPTFGKRVKKPISGLQDDDSDSPRSPELLQEPPAGVVKELSGLQINSDQDGMFVIIDDTVPGGGGGKGLQRVHAISDRHITVPGMMSGPELAGRSKAEAEWGAKRYLAKAKVWLLSEQYIARSLAGPDEVKGSKPSVSAPNSTGTSLKIPGVKGVQKMLRAGVGAVGVGVGSKKDKSKGEKCSSGNQSAVESLGSFKSASMDSDDDGSFDSPKTSARDDVSVGSNKDLRGRRRAAVFGTSTDGGVLDGKGRKMQGMALDGHGGVYLCSIDEDLNMSFLCNVSNIMSCEPLPLRPPDKHSVLITYLETPRSPEHGQPVDILKPRSAAAAVEPADDGKVSTWKSFMRVGPGSLGSGSLQAVWHGSLDNETDSGNLRTVTIAFESKEEMDQWINRLKPSKVEKGGKVHVFAPVRAIVSGNRRRYQDGVYDLDLSYITPTCIAMSFPAEDTVGPFSVALRNKLTAVKQFFEEKHRDRYKLFNLCAEKTYDEQKFGGHVEHVPFLDHHPPSLRQIKHFVYTAEEWRKHRSGAVCAVHCKGGKGRTGAMVACWLLLMGEAEGCPIRTAQEAIDVFVAKRTLNMSIGKPQGPTCAGQRRYVSFYERALRGGVPNRPVQLLSVTLRCVPLLDEKFRPVVRVVCLGRQMYLGVPGETWPAGAQTSATIDLTNYGIILNEDFNVYIFNGAQKDTENEQKLADGALAFVCTHTGMETGQSPWRFDRGDLDGALDKDKECKVFPKDFGIDLNFKEMPALQKFVMYDEDIEDMVMRRVGATRALEFKAGAVVCNMGALPEQDHADLYIVQSGSVRAEKLAHGKPIVKERNSRIFGEAGFLLGTPRASDVVTNKDSKIWVLNIHTAEHLMQQDMYSLYQLLCLKIARKLSKAPTIAGPAQIERKASAGHPTVLAFKYVQRYHLPPAENALTVSVECLCSKTNSKDVVHGKMKLLNRFIVFDAKGSDLKSEAKVAAGKLIRLRHVIDVRWSPKSLSVGLVVRSTDPKHVRDTESLTFVMNDEMTAEDVSTKVKNAVQLQRNFSLRCRLAGSPICAEMIHVGATAVLPELFGETSVARIHTFVGGTSLMPNNGLPENSLVCLLDGIALVKVQGVVTDRIERGDMFNIIRFMHQINYVRHKLPITIDAGPEGATVAAVTFDFVRSLVEKDSGFALRFYEYSAKLLARQLYDSWWLE